MVPAVGSYNHCLTNMEQSQSVLYSPTLGLWYVAVPINSSLNVLPKCSANFIVENIFYAFTGHLTLSFVTIKLKVD